MKNIIWLVVFVLSIQTCFAAKVIDKSIDIGYSANKVIANFGKPDIETEDSEENLTWIYDKQIPENNLLTANSNINKSVFVVKFNNKKSVKSYSYQFIMDVEK